MFCSECGMQLEEGQPSCPSCFALVQKPGLWRRLRAFFAKAFANKSQTVAITTKQEIRCFVDKATGELQSFHSLDEVPPEMRAQIEKAMAATEAALAKGLPLGHVVQSFTYRDADGQQQTYHSLDEMPPEVRAALEKIPSPELLSPAAIPGMVKEALEGSKPSHDSPPA